MKIKKIFEINTFVGMIIAGIFLFSGVTWAAIFYSTTSGSGAELVGHWPLDLESLKSATITGDKTPYSNDGTITGATTTTDRMGQAGRAMEFDGVDDYISAGSDVADFESEGTVSMWVYATSRGGLFSRSVGTSWDDERYVWNFYATSSFVRLVMSDGTTHYNYSCSDDLPINQWVLLTITHDGSNVKFYQNGAFVNSVTQTITPEMSGVKTWIGKSEGITPDNFTGKIADVRIYNGALTADEIANMYDQYRPQTKTSSLQKGLVGHWPLDLESLKNATSTTADKTPYSNDGTIYGATTTTDRMGHSGGAMEFDGVDDKISANGIIDYVDLTTTGNMTMCGWYKRTSGSGAGLTGFAIDGLWNSYLLFSWVNDSEFRFVMKGDSGTFPVISYTTDFNGEWAFICGIKTGENIELFVNGVSEGSNTTTGLSGDIIVSEFDIGWGYNDDYAFNGSIADVRVYNYALDTSEIENLYQSYRPMMSSGSLQKGLVLDMPLDSTHYNSTTLRIDDKSAYSNHGTNSGATVGSEYATFVASESDQISISDVDDVLSFGDGSTDEPFSLCTWFKKDSSGDVRLISKGAVDSREYSISNSASDALDVGLFINDWGNSAHIRKVVSILDDTWYHLCSTYDGNGIHSGITLYLDGESVGTGYSSGTYTAMTPSTEDFEIGSWHNSVYNAGLMSGVKIYNRVLSSDEVQLLYDKGR